MSKLNKRMSNANDEFVKKKSHQIFILIAYLFFKFSPIVYDLIANSDPHAIRMKDQYHNATIIIISFHIFL